MPSKPLKKHSVKSLILFLVLLILTAVWPLSPVFAFVDRGEVVAETLPNGLEVLVREEPGQKVVELQVWVGVGGRDEPAGKEGIAHLFEHMLFKGTKKRGVGEIARTIEAAGGDINAYTAPEQTVYHITIASEYFETALDILADAVMNSTFDKDELEREKLVVIEEIHRGNDNPARVFIREMFKAAYDVHPYGRTVIGTPESVSSVSRKDMIEFHKAWYVPRNMKLVVVGGVRADEVVQLAGGIFQGKDVEGAIRRKITEPPREALRNFRLTLDSEPARLALAFPAGKLTDPDTPVMDLMAAILSGGRSARLQVELRDTGLVHSTWAYAYTPLDPGLFVVGATMSQGNITDAMNGLLLQIARLQSEPVSGEELERARKQIISEKIFSRERVEGMAREIGYMALNLKDLDFNDRYYSRLQSVDPGDIMEVARRIFRPEKATVGFLSRDGEDQPGDWVIDQMFHEILKPGDMVHEEDTAPVYRSILPNGIVLLVREDRRLPLVAARIGVLGGVRYESEQNQGAFNLLAHLLTRGTRHRSARQLAEELDDMSASVNGFSGRNSFGLTGKFLSGDIDVGLGIMREVLTEADLPSHEVELYRERVISSILARKDDMTSSALDLFRRTLFREHPYRFPVAGTEESIASIGRDDLLSILRSVVRPHGMVISVAGNISVDEAYRLAEQHFGNLVGERYDPGPLPVEVVRSGIVSDRIHLEEKAQTHVILGYPGPSLDSQDLDVLEVLNAVLAGQGGRLFTQLRDGSGLAYSVFSFVAPGVDPGYIAFGIGINPDREDEAVEGFLEQIRRIRDEAVPEYELERAKRYLIGSRMISLQTLQARADEVFFPALYGQDLQRELAFRSRLHSVTTDQVKKAAQKYLDPENYVLAVVEGGGREKQE
jgi:zinc protease